MELEFWAELSQAICDVQQQFKINPLDTYPTPLIMRVHLWSVLHDRPTRWACSKKNWTRSTLPPRLPDQSTMSRRLRRADFARLFNALFQRLNGKPSQSLLKIIDGKPLELPNHTTDPDAAWGRGVSRKSVGYKIHMICSTNPLPDAFAITPLDVCEKQMALRMVKRVSGTGYLLGDAHYDASWLFEGCRYYHHQLVCPRPRPHTGLGHHYQSSDRLRAIQMLEPPGDINQYGPSLYRRRKDIERHFSGLVCFGGGLTCLPPWVRRIRRVRNWVSGKLLINAVRIRLKRTYNR